MAIHGMMNRGSQGNLSSTRFVNLDPSDDAIVSLFEEMIHAEGEFEALSGKDTATKDKTVRGVAEWLVGCHWSTNKALVKEWIFACERRAQELEAQGKNAEKVRSRLTRLHVLDDQLHEPRIGRGATIRVIIALIIVGIYLVAGAFIFRHLERQNEIDGAAELNYQVDYVSSKANSGPPGGRPRNITAKACKERIDRIAHALVKSGGLDDPFSDPELWKLRSSFFFCVTVLSTIGYGVTAPETDEGRLFTVVYALAGIPLMSYLLFQINSIIMGAVSRVYHYCRPGKGKSWTHFKLIVSIILVIAACILGSIVYVYREGWTYATGFYFSFITLSTIGFGDEYPDSASGQLMTFVYILLFMGCVSATFSTMQDGVESLVAKVTKACGRGGGDPDALDGKVELDVLGGRSRDTKGGETSATSLSASAVSPDTAPSLASDEKAALRKEGKRI